MHYSVGERSVIMQNDAEQSNKPLFCSSVQSGVRRGYATVTATRRARSGATSETILCWGD